VYKISGLYLVTDSNLCQGRALEAIVEQAVKGGVCIVQLREKYLSTRLFIDLAIKIKNILNHYNVPLIINDRADVALAVGADGLHIGQDDMPYDIARKLLGKKAIIGLSVENWDDVEKAQNMDIDYIGVSPIFETPTKTDTKGSWGLDGLKKIRAFSKHPLVAIGGINKSNANDIILAGADSIAVVSAICSHDDPYLAAVELSGKFRK